MRFWRSGVARRGERGVVYPSPVVILSVIATAMAGIAFVATRGEEPTERRVEIVDARPTSSPTPTLPTAAPKPRKPPVKRDRVYVEVFNNSGITGLAADVAGRAGDVGWNVVGADNWYGTIPATTVYYPPRLKRAARLLALDLGVRRTAPSVDPMKGDRLTLILTDALA